MARYFMYIPWNEYSAGDYIRTQKRVRWPHGLDLQGGTKAFGKVYYNTGGNPFKFTDDGGDVQIYVRGHGSAGSGWVSRSRNVDKVPVAGIEAVTAEQVVKGIIAKGLKTNFSGKIKFYNCHSAEGGEASFAAQCAAHFRSRGYNNAHFFGYNGSIGGTYKYGVGGQLSLAETGKMIDFANFHRDINEPASYRTIVQLIMDKRYAHKWVTVIGTKQRVSSQRVPV